MLSSELTDAEPSPETLEIVCQDLMTWTINANRARAMVARYVNPAPWALAAPITLSAKTATSAHYCLKLTIFLSLESLVDPTASQQTEGGGHMAPAFIQLADWTSALQLIRNDRNAGFLHRPG
jgi:hypothetical protein